jgi:hypothetical protein
MGSGEPLVVGANPVANHEARVLGSPRITESPGAARTHRRRDRLDESGTGRSRTQHRLHPTGADANVRAGG